jgi:hypothetical protein
MALRQACVRAARRGILIVAAAGNNGQDNDASPRYPASYDTTQPAGSELPASYDAVISVAAIAPWGDLAVASNYGAASVDIGAPGVGIVSTSPVNGYRSMTGTSMATAHMTGAVAMYRAMNRGASPQSVRSAILSRATSSWFLSGRTVTGGRLNVGDFPGSRPPFTDAPLIPAVHQIRAVHIMELRARINDLRVRQGLAAVAWTNPSLAQSVVRAVHLVELRSAVDDVYVAEGRQPPSYTDSTLSVGATAIKAVHITDLRAAVEALEP